ncbi:hypothetical protein BT96DRAFT_145850 [Gymnopus androsaceus JB14]|uniref:Uncharacterized protein n=1 Tax=Gymnopus androsaceus JB14 TaxID=1447944 RepID=A0A6A4HBM6_9AGAR|nr:hypothetical protein BT96DRAFT_145850 [Gymnopus androsaceus JB14]
MSPYSKCPTCGASNFTPRLDVDSDAMEERLADPSACPEIEETLSLLEEDYENCASEIARLQLQIQILSSRQQKSKACKSKLQSLLSPCSIQKLPTEILMSIFDLVSHDNQMRESPNLNSSQLWANSEDGPAAMPALVVSSVCSRWRELALAYPAIWSRISLILDAKGTNELFAVTVKLYIKRSGSSLLRLRIDTPSSFFKGLLTPHPVLSLIGLHSNRWQQLTFVGANYFSREIFSIPANVHQFPVLEALELDFCSRESLEVFGQAPCLRSLCVSYLVIELRSNFPWKQLTSLDVACKGRMDGLAYFCPNITSLQLRLDHFSPFPEIATPPRVFPALQSLSVIITDILEEANLERSFIRYLVVTLFGILPEPFFLRLDQPFNTRLTAPRE